MGWAKDYVSPAERQQKRHATRGQLMYGAWIGGLVGFLIALFLFVMHVGLAGGK